MKFLAALMVVLTATSAAYASSYSDEQRGLAAESICNQTDGELGARLGGKMLAHAQGLLEADAARKGQTLDEHLKDPTAFKGFVDSLAATTSESALATITPEDLVLLSMDYGIRFQLFATTAFEDSENIDAAEKILQGSLIFNLMGVLANPEACATGTNTVQSDRSTTVEKPHSVPTPISGGSGSGSRR